MDEFLSPEELWHRYRDIKHIAYAESEIIQAGYYFDDTGKTQRYYQREGVNRTIEAVVKGQKRILLVMAHNRGGNVS